MFLIPLAVQLELNRAQVQKDKVNPPDGDEGELVHWKRVKMRGVAIGQASRTSFTARLDLRPRLLQVHTRQREHRADRIARSLVNHICRFSLSPKEDLFHPHLETAKRAEWIVQDANHVSGILHRLQEESPLSELKEPPLPPGLREVLDKLMQDVKGNRASMERWQQHAITLNKPVYGLHFSNASWEALGDGLATLLHDRDALTDFAAFFEFSRAYAAATEKAMESWEKHRPGMASNPTSTDNVWAFFTFHHGTAIQIADRLEERFSKA